MNGKRAIKNNERNHPVKKSVRIKKEKIANLNAKEQSSWGIWSNDGPWVAGEPHWLTDEPKGLFE